ncbi:tetratricopeptide repeat protein [Actinoplanes philippinensis]|uniref:tetratricopeptide repeat protein n=1 Tax=Actinoplanes philippinensis TaxID=35752 RepID=UPI0033FCEDEF
MLPRQPVLDPAAAYPLITGLRDALDSGDWPACRAVLDAAGPVERTELTTMGLAEPGLATFLRGVLDGDPGDGAAAVLLARHLLGADGPVAAERLLIDAAARSPRDPAIWTARLSTARELRLGRSEADRRYGRLAEIDPHHLPGQREHLRQLCPDPGGDWEPAHTFARAAAESAPPGSFGPVLIAEAHLEHWRAEHGRSASAGRRYLAADDVRAELHEAARRSVWHADFRHGHGWVRVTSTFAMVFALLDDRPAADSLFTTLGDLGSAYPWDHLGDPGSVIAKYRRRAAGGGT